MISLSRTRKAWLLRKAGTSVAIPERRMVADKDLVIDMECLRYCSY